jgi:ABC-2 type transport system ATP-binding protein
VQVDAPQIEAVRNAFKTLPGVSNITIADQRQTTTGFEVECQRDHDIRRDLARAVVSNGWGLLELRPLRMSLEEIFLQLTTQEQQAAAAAAAAGTEAPTTPEPTEGGDTTHA